jgi:hypothetical protein
MTSTLIDLGGPGEMFDILVTNRAPVLDATALFSLPANQLYPQGTLVRELVGAAISDDDPDAVQGIAITQVTEGVTWYFNTSGFWFSNNPTSQFAVLLRGDDQIAFSPNFDYQGPVGFAFRAWDQTQGSIDEIWYDLSGPEVVGGATAFSKAEGWASSYIGTAASISGVVFNDVDRDGWQQSSEPGIEGWLVYADQNNNQQFDFDEPRAWSDEDGAYTIDALPPGTYTVRAAQREGGVQSWPLAGSYATKIGPGEQAALRNFAMHDDQVVAAYQNVVNRLDVNNDGLVSPLDALNVINELRRAGPRLLAPPKETPTFYWDVNGDGLISPLDALQIINRLNRQVAAAAAPGMAAVVGDTTLPSAAEAVGDTSSSLSETTAAATLHVSSDSPLVAIPVAAETGEFDAIARSARDVALRRIAAQPLKTLDHPQDLAAGDRVRRIATWANYGSRVQLEDPRWSELLVEIAASRCRF